MGGIHGPQMVSNVFNFLLYFILFTIKITILRYILVALLLQLLSFLVASWMVMKFLFGFTMINQLLPIVTDVYIKGVENVSWGIRGCNICTCSYLENYRHRIWAA